MFHAIVVVFASDCKMGEGFYSHVKLEILETKQQHLQSGKLT